jgi:hypothetical protein
MRRKGFLVLLALVLSSMSCTSIPLGTMLKMRNMSVHDLAAIDPNEIGVKMTTKKGLVVKPDASKLSIGLFDDSENARWFDFSLEIVGRNEKKKGVFRRKKLTVTTLKITDEGIEEFLQLQAVVNQKDFKVRKVFFKTSSSFEDNDELKQTDRFVLSIDLKLFERQGYFTLVDNAKVKMNKPKPK